MTPRSPAAAVGPQGQLIRVYLEVGKTWTFACAIDQPGWQRRGKGEVAALDALEDYRERYAAAVGMQPFGDLQVIGRLPGTMTTDFGAPDVSGPWDDEELRPEELMALQGCWDTFDRIVERSSLELAKGPRGGGRDRDQIQNHVRESERAYGRKVGGRVAPRTPWAEQRNAALQALSAPLAAGWSPKYAVRRMAWHVLDHAWEIEDKSVG